MQFEEYEEYALLLGALVTTVVYVSNLYLINANFFVSFSMVP